MNTYEISLNANNGGKSTKLALSAVSAQSIACAGGLVLVTPTVNCFFRIDNNPVALVDVDQILLANNSYRIVVVQGWKLAFVSETAGFVYITQEP